MKSPGKILEEYGGWILFVIFFIASFIVSPETYDYSGLIRSFPSIGLGVFGFMLTFIAIILQSTNKTIDYMKEQKVLFESFINYNKRVVYESACLTLYSYFASCLTIPIDNAEIHNILKLISISFFWGQLAKLCIDTFFFIKVFYILLRQ